MIENLAKGKIKEIYEYHKELHGKNLKFYAVVNHCLKDLKGLKKSGIEEYLKELIDEDTKAA